jgi:hypothetical protein
LFESRFEFGGSEIFCNVQSILTQIAEENFAATGFEQQKTIEMRKQLGGRLVDCTETGKAEHASEWRQRFRVIDRLKRPKLRVAVALHFH